MEILSVSNIQKRRGEPLFAPVSFTLEAGEGLGIYGQNGQGKTTLLDIIAGILKPDTGTVTLGAMPGYVMQEGGFQEGLSCRDNLIYEASLCGFAHGDAAARVSVCAEHCGVTPFLKKRLSKCSAGMRARVSIAAALISEPGLLLLDEPFNALDQTTQFSIRNLLAQMKAEGTAILLVSHEKSDFENLCERILTLPDAQIKPL
jgi:ABC-type multidrug transport system ATPase subunit